jgi:hypothetical protein
MSHRHLNRPFLFLRVLAALCLLAGAAWAGTYSYSATHKTQKSPEQVLAVLTAYGQICDSGCKYWGPGVVTFFRLEAERTPNRWYTWSHVQSGPKHTKYFSEVTLTMAADGGYTFVVRQLEEKDKALAARLSAASKKEHAPVFDVAITTFTVKKVDGGTSVTQAIRMAATGFVTMFPGKIADGMKEGCVATFKNIEK